MRTAWGVAVYRRRWPVIALVLAVAVLGGAWGLGVFGRLSQGGYTDPGSESARAQAVADRVTGGRSGDVLVEYTAAPGHTVDERGTAAAARAVLHALPRSAVRAQVSYWDTRSPGLVTPDHRAALASITLTDPAAYQDVNDRLAVSGLTARIGGPVPLRAATDRTSTEGLELAEAVSLPITLVLLLLVFGSVVAAALPVLVGTLTIGASLGVLRLISLGTDVNGFAPNVVSLLGLGLAVDYGLFTVGRFREELAAGRDTATAIGRTVATSGRTVAFSATLLVVALSGLLVFPVGFLRSLAYGGMAAVAVAATVSLTLLPAVLGVLGGRVNRWAVPRPRGRARLAGLADLVLRRPVVFAVPIVAGLLLLALPFGSVRFGAADQKQLPAGDLTRQAVAAIDVDFPATGENAALLVARGAVGPLVVRADRVPGVVTVVRGPSRDGVTLLTATLAGDPLGDEAEHAVAALRSLAPDRVLVGGFTASATDSVRSVVDGLPLMAAILVAATLTVMFLAFRSVLLPVKAVLCAVLSLGATFGVLVAVTRTPVQPEILVLIGAVVFGLSTDYETFLLSRMVEARAAGLATADAIRTGLARTGTMISSAALLLVVVTGAFGLSPLGTMRFLGIGMIVALVLDATVVRLLLVPALLRLLGDAAWWPRSARQRRHRPRPGQHDQPLHGERHGDVEQQRGRRETAGRPVHTALDQHVGAEVHADRDQPQHHGQRVALPVQHAVLPPQPHRVRAQRTERGGQHETGDEHADGGAGHRVVGQEPHQLDDPDPAEDEQ
ncbi:MAG TPA: MMPL family transporter [Pseudonocardiaceae bacterium]|nr:MMPL family transporter [Pseudonocardiaceae bacterium]